MGPTSQPLGESESPQLPLLTSNLAVRMKNGYLQRMPAIFNATASVSTGDHENLFPNRLLSTECLLGSALCRPLTLTLLMMYVNAMSKYGQPMNK